MVNHKIFLTMAYFRYHNKYNATEKLFALMKNLDSEESVLYNVDLRKLDQSKHA